MTHALPPIDLAAAHRHFAVDCFNRAWELIDQPQRSPAEAWQMIGLSLASLWHWRQRADCTPQNMSIGHWQASRVFALAQQADNARYHAQRALEFSAGLSDFFIGYAHEALARAARLANDPASHQQHLAQARACLAALTDPQERALLSADLESLS